MSASVLYMSMSLDGYIAGPNDAPGNPSGDGGAAARLHKWGLTGQLNNEYNATGAVLVGR